MSGNFTYDGYQEGIEQVNAERGAQVIQIDSGKHIAIVAICAVICGICAAISWWAVNEQRVTAANYREDTLSLQDQYLKERNHVIELEARTKVLSDDLQEMRNVKR